MFKPRYTFFVMGIGLTVLMMGACALRNAKHKDGEETESAEDRAAREETMRSELAGFRDAKRSKDRVLGALSEIHQAAQEFAERSIRKGGNGISLEKWDVARLKEICARLTETAELGQLAKCLWHTMECEPQDYGYAVWMSFFFCVAQISDRSDDEAEKLLKDLYDNYANDGGNRLLMNDILEHRQREHPEFNRGPFKNFKRDDEITTEI